MSNLNNILSKLNSCTPLKVIEKRFVPMKKVVKANLKTLEVIQQEAGQAFRGEAEKEGKKMLTNSFEEMIKNSYQLTKDLELANQTIALIDTVIEQATQIGLDAPDDFVQKRNILLDTIENIKALESFMSSHTYTQF